MHQHNFTPSLNHKGYEHCIDCGTFHSTSPLTPEEIYENNPYWGEDSGRSTLEQQVSNMTTIDDCGISKVDRVLQFVPDDADAILEIACAPGELLRQLSEMGRTCVGVEPSKKYLEFISNHAPKAGVVIGYYPQVFTPQTENVFDCIIGLDVMEHIEDFDGFIAATYRLLVPGGTAIFMSPIIYEDGLIRSGEFKPDEHIWIFSKKFLEEYFKPIFSGVRFSRWLVSHELVILKK